MATKNALRRQPAEGFQPPRNREERRRTRIEQEREFKKRAKRYEKRKKLKEALETAALGITLAIIVLYMLFFAPDPEVEYRNRQAMEYAKHTTMMQAIGSDYMIPADDYDQYLADREAFLLEERRKEGGC